MPHSATRQLVLLILSLLALATPLAAQPQRDSRPLGPAPVAETGALGRTGTPAAGAGTLRTAASLAGVLGIIFVGAALLRRLASRNKSLAGALTGSSRSPAGVLEILGRYPLARGNTLLLLRLDRRVLLISQTVAPAGRGVLRPGGASLTTLTELTDAEEVASILAKTRDADNESISARFQSVLSDFSAKGAPEQPVQPAPEPVDAAHPTVVVRTTSSWAARAPLAEEAHS